MAKQEQYKQFLHSEEQIKKRVITLDKEFMEITNQLQEIADLEAKEDDLAPEQKSKVARKTSMETKKTQKISAQSALKKEQKSAETAVKNAKLDLDNTSKEFVLIKRFCQKAIGVDSLSEMGRQNHQSTPKRQKMEQPTGAHSSQQNHMQTGILEAPSVANLLAETDQTAVTSEVVNGMVVPSFILKTKAYRTPDLIMKDLAELVKNPAFFEVKFR